MNREKYAYLLSNDNRTATIENLMKEVAEMMMTGNFPSATTEKSKHNCSKTIGYYMNIHPGNRCTDLINNFDGTREVIVNFAKKFQYPNTRTPESYLEAIADGMEVVPLRLISEILDVMYNFSNGEKVYITQEEAKYFVFYNGEVVKDHIVDLKKIVNDIYEFRKTNNLPTYVSTNEAEHKWNQEKRQIRELMVILSKTELFTMEGGAIVLDKKGFNARDKELFHEIVSYNRFWRTSKVDMKEITESYESYMDIDYDIYLQVTKTYGKSVTPCGTFYPDSDVSDAHYEGAKKRVYVNRYERDPKAREDCIKYYGCTCQVCGMDFAKKYGELGDGFIHVHHVVPIHEIGEEYELNPVEDLIPVCPNCHAMLHRKLNGEKVDVEKLKEIIEKNRDK